MKKIISIWVSIINQVKQHEDGSFVAGHNGPHGDQETPVRTTAHLLYILCKLIDLGHNEYRGKANKAIDYLISPSARPMGASFWCRVNPEKDFCNGLIGQAWVMESLVYAANVLKRSDCFEVVDEVLAMHKWNSGCSAWHKLNVDGSCGELFGTFNQQLWFAYISIQMGEESKSYNNGVEFVSTVLPRVELYSDGIIYHDSPAYKMQKMLGVKSAIKELINFISRKSKKSDKRARSVGYHSFNLIALKGIEEKLPENKFWYSCKYKKIVKALYTEKYKRETKNNKFAYPYNPVGFENAYFLEGKDKELAIFYLVEQLNYIYYDDKKIVVRDSQDAVNSLARIYESCRLSESILSSLNDNN
ncbi:hypothetical protein [Pseudoalteromonas distincta]|uniref:Agl cluster protein AglQ n=1 Tax=Pseudoalteromonas distincta TaxID=77608 RepID=A0A4P9IY59_9GAMM|nr:hypothetical protein [Pseudoalteromonas distincta]QCU73134.1 hypothetical protein FFU37_01055 [Pseudoalteromonas distincta]